MRNLVFLFLVSLLMTSAARAQSYIDITESPYSANTQCKTNEAGKDAGFEINAAITAALNYNSTSNPYASGSVIYFPPGCYLITTQILDPGATSGNIVGLGITFLGYGRVEFQAGSGLTGSIIQFGSSTQAATHRRISNIFFNCNQVSGIDGIDIDGLANSVLDQIEVRDCPNYAIRVMGSNTSNYGNTVIGGVIGVGTGVNLPSANGIALTNAANSWTFNGTYIDYAGAGTPTGIGLDIEYSNGVACIDCTIQGWNVGLWAASNSDVTGLEVSGGYFEFNKTSAIILGSYAGSIDKAYGISVHGAYFDGSNSQPVCLDMQQADGFSVVGNEFHNCTNTTVRALPDISSPGNYEGADDGIVGPNNFIYTGSTTGVYSLQGSNITLFAPACISNASPAACGYTSSGFVALPAAGNTLVVDAPFVSATSRISVSEDMTLGSKLGVTCNTVGGRTYSITSKTPGTSFTITSSTAPTVNPACLIFNFQN